MKIYIEIIIALILIIIFLCWKIWLNRSKKKLLKNYNLDDDKARRCETFWDNVERTEPITDAITDNGTGELPVERSVVEHTRPYQSERFKFFSSATPR